MNDEIVEFDGKDKEGVVNLWRICGLVMPWNDPGRDIDRSLSNPHGRIFLIKSHLQVIGSVMVGYDGHRGWVYYLSVHPDWRNRNLGRKLMKHSEEYLRTVGCPKLNLMVRTSNSSVLKFYDRLEYLKDEVVVMSKRLISDP